MKIELSREEIEAIVSWFYICTEKYTMASDDEDIVNKLEKHLKEKNL